MMRIALVGLAALTLGAPVTPRPQQPTISSFNLTIQTTPTGWAAVCKAGCQWTRVTLACDRICDAAISAEGIARPSAVPAAASTFRFVVQHTESGVRAVAQTGTAWKTLSWSCGLPNCGATVTQYGVSGIERTP